jgi:kojibiose phosphorylase
MGNAAGGVHIAALGGLWQAAVLGFAGMQLGASARPTFTPHLPSAWTSMRFPLSIRGELLDVQIGAASSAGDVHGPRGVRVRAVREEESS